MRANIAANTSKHAKHPTTTLRTPYEHLANTMRTPYEHPTNTLANTLANTLTNTLTNTLRMLESPHKLVSGVWVFVNSLKQH